MITTADLELPTTIDHPAEYLGSLWDWSILEGCFGDPKRRPTDIDGTIEWRGHLLMIETKGPRAWLPYGQRRTYEWLVAGGNITVVVVWGQTNQPSEILVMRRRGNKFHPEASVATLRTICDKWYEYANTYPRRLPNGLPHPYPQALADRLPGRPPLDAS